MRGKVYKRFFSGLSGIVLPIPKYQYPAEYRETSRLTYYASQFNSIEINSSFYKVPMKTTVAKWASAVPPDFRFTFKLFREITHAKNLDFDPSLVGQFMETISCIGNKRGSLLVQFPPSLKNQHLGKLEILLGAIRQADPQNLWNVAVEFRDKSWYTEEVNDVLTAYDSNVVIHDLPASAPPSSTPLAECLYIRFHGPTGRYRGSYPDAFLHEYSGYIGEWLSEGKTVYVYFNNTAGDAFNNLSSIRKYVLKEI
jgi:uncharacterized protein YecE (DUF72 family)